jgi:endonuclease/exonuclease/phosphatase family metal-dependent hydrolase
MHAPSPAPRRARTFTRASRRLIAPSLGRFNFLTCQLFTTSTLALVLGFLGLANAPAARAGTFRVATYNLENYLDEPTATRPRAKSAAAKAVIRQSIRALNPDLIALEEMGATNALLELRRSLRADGLDFPYWEHISGADNNIHVAVLSQFPIIARNPHTNETFLLDGRPFRVSRGFAELTVRVRTNFNLTLLAAHLKSRRPVPGADEAQERLGEARVLRGIVDGLLRANPDLPLIVLGDFNDVKDAESTRTLMGRGKARLTDTRPAERNSDTPPAGGAADEPRTITWTHYYAREDTYSRIDYILLSRALAAHWRPAESYVLNQANWGVGSDHRPIVAAFDDGAGETAPGSGPETP